MLRIMRNIAEHTHCNLANVIIDDSSIRSHFHTVNIRKSKLKRMEPTKCHDGNTEIMQLLQPPPPPPTASLQLLQGNEVAAKISQLKEQAASNIIPEEVFDCTHNEEIREQYGPILGSVKCVIISLEGTLFDIRCDDVVPTDKAVEAFAKLKRSGLKILLVVNTWLKEKNRMLNILNKLGFPVTESELFTSSDCCKLFMKRKDLKTPFLLVSDDVLKDFPEFKDELVNPLQFDSIVLGLPSTMIDYRLMTKSLSILYNGHPLIVLNPAISEKGVGPCKISASGGFASILQFATDTNRFILGKPCVGFYVEACKYVGVAPNECVMIGDDVGDDVRIPKGKGLCMKAVLVKTGKYKDGDETKYCEIRPELLVDNFYKAIKYILAATDTNPDKETEEVEEAKTREQWKDENTDFSLRVKASANETENGCGVGGKKSAMCPIKVESFVW